MPAVFALAFLVVTQAPLSTNQSAQAYRQATTLAMRLGGPTMGNPTIRRISGNGRIEVAWPRLVVQFTSGPIEPVVYFDSSIGMAAPAATWCADAATVQRTPWMRDALKKAVMDPALLAALKPVPFPNLSKENKAFPNSTVQVRWVLPTQSNVPFHPLSPPAIIFNFNSTTHRIAGVDWHLAHTVKVRSLRFKAPEARARLAALFKSLLKRNGLPAFAPGKLRVSSMYVMDNGQRVLADGRWVSRAAISPDFRTYFYAYVGVYGGREIWLDPSTLACLGGIRGPGVKPWNVSSVGGERADKG